MSTATKSRKSLATIGGIIGAIALALFGYLMWYTAPGQITESVKLIAVTDDGCVVETIDGYAITVSNCVGKPGDTIVVTYDPKVKERAAAMNPIK